MSRSKEQCIHIINQQFKSLNDKKDEKSLFIALEKTVKDISGAEFSLIWLMDNRTNKIKSFHQNRRWEFELKESIVKKVLLTKRGFFDNYVVSHPEYNPKIDNILKIKIKSMIVVPILDKGKESVVAFIVAFNSVKHKEIFRRYDIRLLGLLDASIFNMIKLLRGQNHLLASSTFRKTQALKSVKREKEKELKDNVKMELERALTIQKERVATLEKELQLKTEALEKRENQVKRDALAVISQEEHFSKRKCDADIYTILNFLNNEVTYLANEEHKIYLFLEIIKNSLHNKEQLQFLNSELEKIQLIERLANGLYCREKMPIVIESFNIYQLVNDISTLYSKTFSDRNITFNIFLDPKTPNLIDSDKYKIKSLIVHLINNIFNFTTLSSAVALHLHSSDNDEFLTVEVKSLKPNQPKKMTNFFAHKELNQTLTSSESGLGLSVASNLVKILGGKLKLSAIGRDEHLFTAVIPITKSNESKTMEYMDKDGMKIAILMSEENSLAVDNLMRYLLSMGIDDKFIFTFQSSTKIKGIKISHLFCFENMFVEGLDFNKFSSITVLKYSQKRLKIQKNGINTLYVNSYYGLELQKILFPYMESSGFEEKSLLVEDSFLTKFSRVVKKLKFS